MPILSHLDSLIDRASDYAFDLRYGVETRQVVELADMSLPPESRDQVKRYQGSHVAELRRALRQCELDLRGYRFLDLGCGKGRALFLASLCGFERCLGIEIEPNLCQICRSNISAFCQRTGKAESCFELFEGDVLDYQLDSGPNLFYLFNPFKLELVGQVAEQLKKTSPTPDRDVLMTMNPISDSLLEELGYQCIQELFHYDLNKTVRFYQLRAR